MYIAKACNGISGLDQASGAGERSSVFVSPGTLKTVVVIDWGTSGFDVNHSASAQDFKTFAAFEESFDFYATSLNASKTNKVCESALTASFQHSSSSRRLMRGSTL